MSQIKSVSPKDPDSVEWFSIDFANVLRDGDEIDDLIEVVLDVTDDAETAAEIVEDTPGVNGTVVSFMLSGGTRGFKYRPRARVITEQGETLDLSFDVTIADQ